VGWGKFLLPALVPARKGTETMTLVKRDYLAILTEAFAAPVVVERPSGCGRVYVVLGASWDASEEAKAQAKADAKGIAAAAKKLGKIWQAKSHYGDRNALYVGYDNHTGYELGKGTAIERVLKAHGIDCYRNEHGD